MVFLLLFFPVAALANGAPGFGVKPIESVREVLTYDLQEVDFKKNPWSQANVTATYWMETESQETETISVAFLYVGRIIPWDSDDLLVNVTWDTQGLPVQVKGIPDIFFHRSHPQGKLISVQNGEVVDSPSFVQIASAMEEAVELGDIEYFWVYYESDGFLGKEVLDDYLSQGSSSEEFYLSDYDSVKFLQFEIILEPGRTHVLEVSFPQSPTRQQSAFDAQYSFFYFLEPAFYWKSFSDLTVEILLPEGYKLSDSNLALESVGGRMRGHFAKLPQENWEFSITPGFPGSISRGWFGPKWIGQRLGDIIGPFFAPILLLLGIPLVLWLSLYIFPSRGKGK